MPPCGGHLFRRCLSCWPRTRFKSCPRVGGIAEARRAIFIEDVSSRAPVWGASYADLGGYATDFVSSRAPVWGASVARLSVILSTVFQVVPPCGGHLPGKIRDFLDAGFQVVPPCGGHRGFIPWLSARFSVSSRAPVWGASFVTLDRPAVLTVSSRAPVWGASILSVELWRASGFQVVPPCGGHPHFWRLRSSCP